MERPRDVRPSRRYRRRAQDCRSVSGSSRDGRAVPSRRTDVGACRRTDQLHLRERSCDPDRHGHGRQGSRQRRARHGRRADRTGRSGSESRADGARPRRRGEVASPGVGRTARGRAAHRIPSPQWVAVVCRFTRSRRSGRGAPGQSQRGARCETLTNRCSSSGRTRARSRTVPCWPLRSMGRLAARRSFLLRASWGTTWG